MHYQIIGESLQGELKISVITSDKVATQWFQFAMA